MANGDVFASIKLILDKNPEAITESTKYQLILGGISELYALSKKRESDIERLENMMKPVLTIYKILIFIGGIFVTTLIAFLWGILTGQIQIVYK